MEQVAELQAFQVGSDAAVAIGLERK